MLESINELLAAAPTAAQNPCSGRCTMTKSWSLRQEQEVIWDSSLLQVVEETLGVTPLFVATLTLSTALPLYARPPADQEWR